MASFTLLGSESQDGIAVTTVDTNFSITPAVGDVVAFLLEESTEADPHLASDGATWLLIDSETLGADVWAVYRCTGAGNADNLTLSQDSDGFTGMAVIAIRPVDLTFVGVANSSGTIDTATSTDTITSTLSAGPFDALLGFAAGNANQDWTDDSGWTNLANPRDVAYSLESQYRLSDDSEWVAVINNPTTNLGALVLEFTAADTNWTLVGETSGSVAGSGATATPTLPGPPVEGDLVFVVCGTDSGLGQSVSAGIDAGQGYTYVLDEDLTESAGQAAFKVMTSTPDTTVGLTSRSTSSKRMAYGIQVWRPVDTGTPQDATRTLAENTSSGYPDSPSITTVTDNALVIAFGVLDDIDEEGSVVAPSGYSNLLAKDTDEPTNPTTDGATVMIASKEVESAGAENPGAFSGSGSSSWEAGTVALRLAATTGAVGGINRGLINNGLINGGLIR